MEKEKRKTEEVMNEGGLVETGFGFSILGQENPRRFFKIKFKITAQLRERNKQLGVGTLRFHFDLQLTVTVSLIHHLPSPY